MVHLREQFAQWPLKGFIAQSEIEVKRIYQEFLELGMLHCDASPHATCFESSNNALK
jgi:hypothetical protein